MEGSQGAKLPHFLLLPYPIQGHITPMVKLAHKLLRHGSRVTFLTTEFAHSRMKKAASGRDHTHHRNFRILSVSDGLPAQHERKDEIEVGQSFSRAMPAHLHAFLSSSSSNNKVINQEEIISCVVADSVMLWAVEISKRFGIKTAVLFVSSPGNLSMVLQIPKLIQAGIIDPENGSPRKAEEMEISPNLPKLRSRDYTWNIPGDDELMKKMVFYAMTLVNRSLRAADWVLCNWFSQLDPSAHALLPGPTTLLPVGPLLMLSGETSQGGNLWAEDSTCLSWLDAHPPGSVVYVAFGSTTKFNRAQAQELAMGLELLARPFLWVVRPGLIEDDNDGGGFMNSKMGKVVGWAPQERVLDHPSVACFLTHSGWNSVVEGIGFGVPLLCLPYRGDHFYIRTCVCEGWKVGMELNPDDGGIVTRDEVKRKVEDLLRDDEIKASALMWKELAQASATEGGLSDQILADFVCKMTTV
ncbi:unnamed protein product [Linum trigynum]|uniref:Glycosyltransferase n=1 Tax=Linum trigynum TaxID=586398 RepID=A0AAV2ECD2_9ROSI